LTGLGSRFRARQALGSISNFTQNRKAANYSIFSIEIETPAFIIPSALLNFQENARQEDTPISMLEHVLSELAHRGD
jgi:hypothetical protein